MWKKRFRYKCESLVETITNRMNLDLNYTQKKYNSREIEVMARNVIKSELI